MDSNTVGTLTYFGVAVIVAIISATIMRVKNNYWMKFNNYWMKFDIGDAFLCMLLGVLWPFIIVACVVYLASGFLYSKFFKTREEN